MELAFPSRCLPTLLPNRNPISHQPPSLLLVSPHLSSLKTPGLRFGDVKARATEETPTFVTVKFNRIPSETAAVEKGEEAPSFEAVSAEKGEEVAVVDEEQSEPAEFWNKLDLKLDYENSYSILIYGTGALVLLWLSFAVVSAVDSIPVFPKVMEVVGLAYTVWFSYRYLIFKANRDELLAKIEDLKEQIIGTSDDD